MLSFELRCINSMLTDALQEQCVGWGLSTFLRIIHLWKDTSETGSLGQG